MLMNCHQEGKMTTVEPVKQSLHTTLRRGTCTMELPNEACQRHCGDNHPQWNTQAKLARYTVETNIHNGNCQAAFARDITERTVHIVCSIRSPARGLLDWNATFKRRRLGKRELVGETAPSLLGRKIIVDITARIHPSVKTQRCI